MLERVDTSHSTHERAGSGAFAIVKKVELNGHLYAAKQTDPKLLRYAKGHKLGVDLRRRALKECLLLSSLQHPNIVQFVGVNIRGRRVTLVMEFLPMQLAECLETCGGFPAPLQYRILRDVSQALLYLHSQLPVIIHGDLSANNIMLTQDFTAKVIDLGSSTTVDDVPIDGTASPCPGAMVCMPPEAKVNNPVYDEKLDIFSFGVVTLHVVIGEWPIPPDNPPASHLIPPTGLEAPELQHLVEFLQHMDNHPLLELVVRCLQFDPTNRPSAREIALNVSEITSRNLSSNPQELMNVISQHRVPSGFTRSASKHDHVWTQTNKWKHAQAIHLQREKIELETKQQLQFVSEVQVQGNVYMHKTVVIKTCNDVLYSSLQCKSQL